jgi:glutamine synthetase
MTVTNPAIEPSDAADVAAAACRDAGVRLVRFLWCDNGGVVRGKAVHVDRLTRRMRTGVGVTVAMQAMNSLDQLQPVDDMGPVGEVRLVPDASTFTVLPYAPHSAAMLADHVDLDGRPYGACPRSFLARQAERLLGHGLVLHASVETEFSLAREDAGRYVPVDTSLCFSSTGMAAAAEVIDAIVEALERQGIQVEQYYPELGHGQHELSVAHRPALVAADTQVLVRETIRAVAGRFGLVASLAPKPWPDQAGNGAHIHFSAWDPTGTENRFHDPHGRFGLSSVAERFIAGILAHVPGLLGLTAPSFNSYQRLAPRHWSSAYACWGPDNREATVRVPSTFRGEEHASTNLELKPADASANPYLAIGGLIAAGLDGLERDLALPPPTTVDPADLSDAEREAVAAVRYPETQGDALDRLEADAVLTTALGPLLTRSYLAVRRSEWDAYRAADDDFRYRHHFLKY